jgi:phosphoglycerate dehydrogenase-like enzyme
MFEVMKPGAYFVNVSRGQLVDERSLVDSLNSGHLAGAALDVFSEEPLPPDSPLWTHPNVIITPHLAAYSPNMMNQVVELFIENLKRYLADESLYNLVDLEQGY